MKLIEALWLMFAVCLFLIASTLDGSSTWTLHSLLSWLN